jgi:carbonic anhydrase/acetyltransferase-like protein (isoleucine patch superfamily)
MGVGVRMRDDAQGADRAGTRGFRARVAAAAALLAALAAALPGAAGAGPAGGGEAPAAGPAGQVSLAVPARVAVNRSFVSPLIELFGDVWVGQRVLVTANTVLDAAPGGRICIGDDSNIQDNVVVQATRAVPATHASACGSLAAQVDRDAIVAHQASIANSTVGRFTFVGFRARLEDAVLDEGAFVLHGATIRGVRIGRDKLVPVGAVITAQAEADALPSKSDAEATFQRAVLAVNAELAERYAQLYQAEGADAVSGVSAGPRTSWTPAPVRPTLGRDVRLLEFARLIGDVRLGDGTRVGRRAAIRADEGAPIVVGAGARIADRVTFHALRGTSVRVGRDLQAGTNAVLHGPLQAGDRLVVEADAVLFDATVGDGVTIGSEAVVAGVTLPDGARVPAGATITTQAQADALSTR